MKKNKIGKILFIKIFKWYILIAFTLTALQIYNAYVSHEKDLHHSLHTIEKVFTTMFKNALFALDSVALESTMESIVALDSIKGISIAEPKSKLVNEKGDTLKHEDTILHQFNLRNSDKVFSRVRLYSSSDFIIERMKENVFIIFINSLIKSLLLMLLVYYFSNQIITQTLKELIQVLNRFSTSNSRHLHLKNIDEESEMFQVIQSYNQMKDRVKEETHKNRLLNERINLALLGTNDGIWDWDIVKNKIYLSPRWKEMLGYFEFELTDNISEWKSRIHPKERDLVWDDLMENLEEKEEYYISTHRLEHKKGFWVWIKVRGKIEYNIDRKAIRMIGTQTDITQEKNLQLKSLHLAQMIEQTHDSVISTDLKGHIQHWNRGSTKLFGYIASEMLGKHISWLYHAKESNKFEKNRKVLMQKGGYKGEVTIVAKNKKNLYATLSLSLLKDEFNKPISIIHYAQDITQRKEAEKALEKQKDLLDYQAHHDMLTTLPNRVLFHDRLKQAINKAERHKGKIALLFLDLDHFKEINDSLGHEYGDEVLKGVSLRLKKLLRKQDTIARLGGDEFTVILEDISKEEDVTLIADKILNCLIKPIEVKNHQLHISCSIGVSTYPKDAISSENLLKFADIAMYKAKESGKNNYKFYRS